MVYVMGDIHGNMRRFQSVMDQICLQPEDTLYILGDVIDRHPDGIAILQQIMETPNMETILGNHEFMMLEALTGSYACRNWEDGAADAESLQLWYSNGGRPTHQKMKRLSKGARNRIFRYLKALPLERSVEVNGIEYLLIHAAPKSFYPEFGFGYQNETEFAVWYRNWMVLMPDIPENQIIVFGHTPTCFFQSGDPMEIWRKGQMMGIDCGSGFPNEPEPDVPMGRLACVRLDDMKVFYSDIEEKTGADE